MALCFDVAKCTDFQKHFPDQGPEEDKQWNSLFYALTMLMMLIGPPIEKDMDEFWLRVNIYQRTVGSLAYRTGADSLPEDIYVTEEQAKSLAGLRINISPISKAAFDKKIMQILRSTHERGQL